MRQVGRTLVLCALALLGGCTTRSIEVTSTPSGAEVVLDGELLGRTPLSFPFRYGGERELIFYREGYAPVTVIHDAHRVAYDVFPIDVVVDLTPIGGADRQKLHVDLSAARDLSARDPEELRSALLERADALRLRSERSALQAPPREPSRDPQRP